MESIRIGNDIQIEWGILRDGKAEPLLGKKLELAIIGRYKTMPVTEYTIEGNVLKFTFYGKDQHRCGSYTLILYINKGEVGMATIDYADVFCLVPRSFLAGGQSNNITVSTLRATSDVFIGGLKSSTIGSLENVTPKADTAEEGSLLVMNDDGIYVPDKSLPQNVEKLGGRVKTLNGSILMMGDEVKSLKDNVTELDENVIGLGENITQLDDSVKVIADDVDTLKSKVFPFTMTLSGGGTYEQGSSQTVSLSWTYDRDIESQSINNEPLAVDIRTKQYTGVTANTTYTLRAVCDGSTYSKSVSAQFRLRKYYGVSANDSLTDAEILGMTSAWAQRAQGATVFDCTGGKYVYYVLPTALAADIQFWIGGLQNDDWLSEVRDVTNRYGHKDSYTIFRLNNIQNGVLSIEFK